MSDADAASVRKTIVDQFHEFEKLLGPDHEAVATFFLAGREFRLRVTQVGSTTTGLINIFGEDEAGALIDIFMHYTQLCYVVEAVPADKPHRIGFGQPTKSG